MKKWMIKELNVLSSIYKIRYIKIKDKESKRDKKTGEITYGETDFTKHVIYIYLFPGLEDNELKKTLLHEILEAINNDYYIRLRHDKLEKLENGLYDTWQRNGLKELM